MAFQIGARADVTNSDHVRYPLRMPSRLAIRQFRGLYSVSLGRSGFRSDSGPAQSALRAIKVLKRRIQGKKDRRVRT